MKIQIFNIAFAILMGSLFLTSCESGPQSEETADAKVEEARVDPNKGNQDATSAAQKEEFPEEWSGFKARMLKKIAKNDQRIAELNTKLEQTGTNRDEAYVKRIDVLEQKNEDLRARIVKFENDPSNWQSFKSEFNQDLNDLGKALKDFTVDSK